MAGAGVTVPYPTLPDRVARTALSLAAVGFAYMDALARSDWTAAPGLLALFQELYNNSGKAPVLIGFAPADQLAAANITPGSLAINGQFDDNTRAVLAAALVSGTSGVPLSGWGFTPAQADTMPRTASALGRWFVTTMVPRYPNNSSAQLPRFLWGIARIAETASLAQAAFDVRGAIVPYIEGGASAVDAPLEVDAANAEARRIVESSGGTQTTRAVERGAGVDNPTGNPLMTVFSPMVITGRRPKAFPDWGYYVAGAGILALGGIFAYQNWRARN